MGANNKIKIQLNVRGHSHLFIYFYLKKKKVFTFNSLSVYNYSGSDVCTFSNPTPQNLWTPYHRFHLLVLVAMLKGSSCSEKGPDPISQSRHRARAGLYELTAKGGLKTDKAREGKKKTILSQRQQAAAPLEPHVCFFHIHSCKGFNISAVITLLRFMSYINRNHKDSLRLVTSTSISNTELRSPCDDKSGWTFKN